MDFHIGIHDLVHASHFSNSMISVNRFVRSKPINYERWLKWASTGKRDWGYYYRKKDIKPNSWILDSGSFTRLHIKGYHWSIPSYFNQISRWSKCGNLVAAVSQDYICEPDCLGVTQGSIEDHQRWTILRYKALKKLMDSRLPKTYLMPVLQGYYPEQYVEHIRQYGNLLEQGAWVGVGSLCKRNSNPPEIEGVLLAIVKERPDLKLHGFGIKLNSLRSGLIYQLLHSSDSLAWSFAARYENKHENKLNSKQMLEWAKQYDGEIRGLSVQLSLPIYDQDLSCSNMAVPETRKSRLSKKQSIASGSVQLVLDIFS